MGSLDYGRDVEDPGISVLDHHFEELLVPFRLTGLVMHLNLHFPGGFKLAHRRLKVDLLSLKGSISDIKL